MSTVMDLALHYIFFGYRLKEHTPAQFGTTSFMIEKIVGPCNDLQSFCFEIAMPLPFTFSGPYLVTRLSLFMGSNPKVPFNHSLILKVQDFMIIFSLELVVLFLIQRPVTWKKQLICILHTQYTMMVRSPKKAQ